MPENLEELINSGNYTKAHASISKLCQAYPDNNNIKLLKGYLELKTKRFKDAKNTLLDVLLDLPNDPNAHQYMGEVHLEYSYYNAAYRSFKSSYNIVQSSYTKMKLFELSYFLGYVDKYHEYAFNEETTSLISVLEKELEEFEKTKNKQLNSSEKNIINDMHTCKTQNVKYGEFDINHDKHIITEHEDTYNPNKKKAYIATPNLNELPRDRSEVTNLVYDFIRRGELVTAFDILKKHLDKYSKRELIQYIIYIEAIELLVLILEQLSKMKLCVCALDVANVILYTFSKYEKAHYGCLSYLINENKIEQINNLGIRYIQNHMLYQKTTRLIDEIRVVHPILDIKMDRCSCRSIPREFNFLSYFKIDANFLIRDLYD